MAIKNFRGPRRNQSLPTIDITPFKVRDYMITNLITFKPDQSVEDVIDKLMKNGISGGPVVNDKNELIGIFSEGDCLKQVSESRYYNMPLERLFIENHMTKEVVTINADMSIFDAAKKFLKFKLRRFPVVENGKLIGQITQSDILKAAISLKGHKWR